MPETRNNCYWSKIRSTTLRLMKIGKHESRKWTSSCYFALLLLAYFHFTKCLVAFLLPETIVASFWHLMVLLFKVIFSQTNHSSKSPEISPVYSSSNGNFVGMVKSSYNLTIRWCCVCSKVGIRKRYTHNVYKFS